VPNFTRQEFNTADLEQYNAILDQPLDVRDGTLYLPARPGLGFKLREDVLEQGSIDPS
jgi:L-alanine-DL-glutamate epimerase-like enolase superfamily enzyme